MTNMFKTMIQEDLAKKTKLKQCKQVANLEAQNKLMKQQLAQMKIELEKQEPKKKDGLFKSFNKLSFKFYAIYKKRIADDSFCSIVYLRQTSVFTK